MSVARKQVRSFIRSSIGKSPNVPHVQMINVLNGLLDCIYISVLLSFFFFLLFSLSLSLVLYSIPHLMMLWIICKNLIQIFKHLTCGEIVEVKGVEWNWDWGNLWVLCVSTSQERWKKNMKFVSLCIRVCVCVQSNAHLVVCRNELHQEKKTWRPRYHWNEWNSLQMPIRLLDCSTGLWLKGLAPLNWMMNMLMITIVLVVQHHHHNFLCLLTSVCSSSTAPWYQLVKNRTSIPMIVEQTVRFGQTFSIRLSTTQP